MFTGIVTDLGTVREVQPIGGGHDLRLVIGTSPAFLSEPTPAAVGASIACSGVCLTVVHLAADAFSVDCSAETVGATTLGTWKKGARINLERALRIGGLDLERTVDDERLGHCGLPARCAHGDRDRRENSHNRDSGGDGLAALETLHICVLPGKVEEVRA